MSPPRPLHAVKQSDRGPQVSRLLVHTTARASSTVHARFAVAAFGDGRFVGMPPMLRQNSAGSRTRDMTQLAPCARRPPLRQCVRETPRRPYRGVGRAVARALHCLPPEALTAGPGPSRVQFQSALTGTLCFGRACDEIAVARAFDGRYNVPRMVLPSHLSAWINT